MGKKVPLWKGPALCLEGGEYLRRRRIPESKFSPDPGLLYLLQSGKPEGEKNLLTEPQIEAGVAESYKDICQFRKVKLHEHLFSEVTLPQSQHIILQYGGCSQGCPVPGAHFLSGQPSQYNRYLYIFCPHFV